MTKRYEVKAFLMLPDTFKAPLLTQTIEITKREARDGSYTVSEIAAMAIDKRLTIVVDEERIKEIAS